MDRRKTAGASDGRHSFGRETAVSREDTLLRKAPFRFYWSPLFDLPVANVRRFPYTKYALLRDALVADGLVAPHQLAVSPAANAADIATVHDPHYVTSVLDGSLSKETLKAIGFAWSDALPERSLVSVGGAMAAAHAALEVGLSGQLGGGTHHAHFDRGAGFCIFNDQAVAASHLLGQGRVGRVAVLDLDVHQGDGTATMLADRADAFVASVHGAHNFPFQKARSDLDIGLADGTGDRGYLAACGDALDAVLAFRPDLILYQAGVDALEQDRLGRLAVTLDGLKARDAMVFRRAIQQGVPVSMAIGGGYCDPISLTVAAYCGTYAAAQTIYRF